MFKALLALSTVFVVVRGDGTALTEEELEAGRNFKGENQAPNFELIKKGEEYKRTRWGGQRNWLTSAGGLNRWPGKVVPYLISTTFSAADRTIIASGIAHIQDTSCVTFRAKTASDTDWMEFVEPNPQGCFAVTYLKGMGLHQVNLAAGCVTKGTVEHEVIHILGGMHEQQRPDRDQYIKMDWSKATEQWAPQYWKNTWETTNFVTCSMAGKVQATWNFDDCTSGEIVDNFNDAYDWLSVMHYPLDEVMQLKDGVTLPAGVTVNQVGAANEMTQQDIQKLNKAYSCPATTTAGTATTTTGPATTTAGPAPTTAGPAPTTAGPAPTTAGPAPTTAGPAPTTAGPAPTTAGPAPTTAGPAPTTAGPAPTTAAPAPTTAGACKPCEDVLNAGALTGKYKLLAGSDNSCPGNCEYEKVGTSDKYCLLPNGLYETADLPADQCGA